MIPARACLPGLLALGLAYAQIAYAQDAGAPLSAIDWLSESLREEPAPAPPPRSTPVPTPATPARIKEPTVAQRVSVPHVEVTQLTPVRARGQGLFPPSARGLPGILWAGSDSAQAADLITATGVPHLPALQDLVRDLMLAQSPAPRAGDGHILFLARVDQRLAAGAVSDALSLLEQSGPGQPSAEMLRRHFDAALLADQETRACTLFEDRPSLAPSWPTRIFCLARDGDWSAAALTLGTARALGDITPEEEALLSRFLDPDLYEGEPPLPRSASPSPLEFRIREAIGQPIPSGHLPLAFANADLRPVSGRKFRLEAAERLSRSGALPPERLLDIYLDGRPSASGGVWDRAAAIQALNTALQRSDARAAADALPDAWETVTQARSEVAFATLWGAQLDRMQLQGTSGALAHRFGLLSPAHAALAQGDSLADQIAAGGAISLPAGASATHRALAEAFDGAAPAPEFLALLESDRTGEAILQAVALFELGAAGDPVALQQAVSALRAIGLEQTARRAALQVLLLERRG